VDTTRLSKADKAPGKTHDGVMAQVLQPDNETVGYWTVEADPTFDQPVAV